MNWAYIAGYFDGEGNVLRQRVAGKRKYAPALTWYNTHKESLEAMQTFMGCGRLRARKRSSTKHKVCYVLQITKAADLRRIIPLLLSHSIIKRELLLGVLEDTESMRQQSNSWGVLAAAGEDEIKRLYDDGLSTIDIARHFSCSDSAVRLFMRRHGMSIRTQSEAIQLAMKNPEKLKRLYGKERNLKISRSWVSRRLQQAG